MPNEEQAYSAVIFVSLVIIVLIYVYVNRIVFQCELTLLNQAYSFAVSYKTNGEYSSFQDTT